jgi:hypothetical protein
MGVLAVGIYMGAELGIQGWECQSVLSSVASSVHAVIAAVISRLVTHCSMDSLKNTRTE